MSDITNDDTPTNPIRIVPDANALYGDPFLYNVTAQAILFASNFEDIKLVISEITTDEIRNILREKMDDTLANLRKAYKKAKSLQIEIEDNVWNLGHMGKVAIEAWEKRWETLIDTLPTLPYPTITVKELSLFSINLQRPFLQGDKGLRDFLLWKSILTGAQEDDCTYVLVTNDNAFYEGDTDILHPELMKELVSLHLSTRVVICRSFGKALDNYVKPILNKEQMVEVAIQSGQIIDFKDEDDTVDLVIHDYIIDTDIPDEWITQIDCYGASLDVVEDVTLTDLASTLDMGDMVLVTSEWDASVTINLSLMGYQEESETALVTFTIESIVDPKTLKVESHEVVDSVLTGWYDDETGDTIHL